MGQFRIVAALMFRWVIIRLIEVGGSKDGIWCLIERKLKLEINKIHYHSSSTMKEIDDKSVAMVLTSPPYFNIKDYSEEADDVGKSKYYNDYLKKMIPVWNECSRILMDGGKLIINVPLFPEKKHDGCERQLHNIQADIAYYCKWYLPIHLHDIYIWHRTNPSNKLMFGSYPYPPSLYAQNTCEFIMVLKKYGVRPKVDKAIKEQSKLTKQEWVSFTKQVWNIPIPNKSDAAWGKHPAIMPSEIARRCIKMFSFVGDVVVDPFTGSGTTLQIAKELGRNYIGYEISIKYRSTIEKKLRSVNVT
jgi:DNA modification methylase